MICSDNAQHHANRIEPEWVMQIPLKMVPSLLQRRRFDRARLLGHWYVLLVDGTVQEKCRPGFGQDGKSSTGEGSLSLGAPGLDFRARQPRLLLLP